MIYDIINQLRSAQPSSSSSVSVPPPRADETSDGSTTAAQPPVVKDFYSQLAQFMLENLNASVQPMQAATVPGTNTEGMPAYDEADYPDLPENPQDLPPLQPVIAKGGAGRDFIEGDADNDVLSGGKGNDTISGVAGDDKIRGGAGKDKLDGGFGDDNIRGGTGNDTIASNLGDDKVNGGAGKNDKMVFGGSRKDYVITQVGPDKFRVKHINAPIAQASDGTDTLRGIEKLVFADQTVNLKNFDPKSNPPRTQKA
jgi:hypothetical protein